MGVEWALVDDEAKEYIHLGKKRYAAEEYIGFQMTDAEISKFLANRETETLRLVDDCGNEWDELIEKLYRRVATWDPDPEDSL
jgi:hypothetical protein